MVEKFEPVINPSYLTKNATTINYGKLEVEKKVTELPDNNRLTESDDFALKHKSVMERVRYILRSDILARKDYLWLLLLYYSKCNMIRIICPLEDFHKKTSPESINRARRQLYRLAKKGMKELNWLLTDKEFLENQDKREELFRDYYSTENSQLNADEKARYVK